MMHSASTVTKTMVRMTAMWTFVFWSASVVTTVTAAAAAPRTRMTIYATMPSSNKDLSAVARKQKHDLEYLNSDAIEMDVVYLSHKGERDFIQSHIQECGKAALDVYDSLQDMNHHIQTEIFKWCAMATTKDADIITYIDSSCPIINSKALGGLMTDPLMMMRNKNVAVMDDTTRTVHGSYMQLLNNVENREFSMKMLQYITAQTDIEVLQSHTLLIPRTVYDYIQRKKANWYPLQLSCRKETAGTDTAVRDHSTCATGYCCSIQDTNHQTTLLLSRNYILPAQMIPQHNHRSLPNPFHHKWIKQSSSRNSQNDEANTMAGTAEMNDIPFISTVTVKELSTSRGNRQETPNFYHILEKDDALPSHEHCTKCLREKRGATCESCAEHCAGYCTKLCQTTIPDKPIVQEWTITPPIYSKHPHRLIPRIVHQTWFEQMDSEHYPNMSRLMESFKQSGWDYRFYTDQDIITFLQIHFPPEVLQAYEALIPGAFKADLFRYCVLLIYGGIYADVDIQLQSALDLSIPDDVGFMVPMDEPGKPVQKQMCVWNGLIASAPSHPFLVKAIETIVNQVRNRYTSVDIDATFCPNPELSLLHAYDTLFTAGPCMLGASINRVLGRNPQTSHVPGELHNLWDGTQRQFSIDGTSFVLHQSGANSGKNNNESSHGIEHRIPGRTIILQQNKWDMGAHRFTFVEQNIVVAATDLPDSNDRAANILMDNENSNMNENADGGDESKLQQQHEHYSKAHAKTGVYGVEHLYYDRNIAHEEIRIVIDATLLVKKQLATAVLE